jgi:hypothetical protein
VKRNDGIELAGPAGRRDSWPVKALLAVGGWLVVSPLVLSTTRVTAGVVSAVAGGLAVAVLAGWALGARSRIPPLAIACYFGLWLVAAPALWEFSDGVDSTPGLVPIAPSDVTEPTRAVVARAEWNSILAGLLILLLAGWARLAARADRAGRHRPPAASTHGASIPAANAGERGRAAAGGAAGAGPHRRQRGGRRRPSAATADDGARGSRPAGRPRPTSRPDPACSPSCASGRRLPGPSRPRWSRSSAFGPARCCCSWPPGSPCTCCCPRSASSARR